jgi:hypothetical protein
MHIINRYKIITALLCGILINTTAAKAQSVYKIYVALNGTEAAAGTEDQPVNSIAKAVELAGKVTGAKQIQILVKGGTYHLTQSISVIKGKNWNSEIPLSIEAYNKQPVILHGGKTITPEMMQPVSDKKFLARLQPGVRSKVRQIDLKALGVDPGKLHPVGFTRPFGPAWMEMFINGNPGR